MISRATLCILILTLVLPGIVSGRSCSKCSCSCQHANSRADKAQQALNQANRMNDILRGTNIALGSDFALRVSNNGKTIGYVYDEFSPAMTLPPNSQIQVIPRPASNSTTTYVRIYYDVNHLGLFTDLSVPGNYSAGQISLPRRSISSVVIPKGFQVILYSEDNFQGEHVVLTDSHRHLDKFNDKTQSIEIIPIFTKMPEHIAIVYSHPEHSGKQQGLVVGNNSITGSLIKSIVLHSDYDVFIYNDDVLINVIHSTSRFVQNNHPTKQFNAVVQKKTEHSTKYAVFYEDVDFKGAHFILMSNPAGSMSNADGKLSSMRIPPEYEVVLYDQTNFLGTYVVVSGDVNNLNFYAFNDRAKSILIRPKNVQNSHENVAIYANPNYEGEKMTLPVGHSECSSSLKLLNFCNEAYAASIKVPSGFKVTITKAPNPITRNERVYTYVEDSPEIRSYFDTHLVSVVVEKI
jgi:hypothetical protein